MSSRAKSPVYWDPELYMKRSVVMPLAGYAVA
jgi:hypothetical protein